MRPRLKNQYRLKSTYRYSRAFDIPGEDDIRGFPYRQWFYDINVQKETWVIQVEKEYDCARRKQETLTWLTESLKMEWD